MPSLSTQARIASITAFAEARRIRPIRQRPSLPGQMRLPLSGDNCERNPGGTFAKGNTCQEGAGLSRDEQENTGRLYDRLSSTEEPFITLGPSEAAKTPGFEKAHQVSVSSPNDVSRILRENSVNTKQLAALGVATEPGAKVTVSGYGNRLVVRSNIPVPISAEELVAAGAVSPGQSAQEKAAEVIADTGAHISIDMTLGGVDSQIHYGLFQVSHSIQNAIAMHASVQESPDGPWTDEQKALAELGNKANRFFGGAIIDLMGQSLFEAEKAGIHTAETSAVGRGRGGGQGAGRADSFTFKGYSLWPRFGFDGEIPSSTQIQIDPILREIFAEGPDSPRRRVLTEDGWEKWQSGSMRIQDLVETPQGERIWRDYGSSAHMSIDFRDKESKGYKKFTEAKETASRAKRRRERRDLSQWLWDTDFRFDPEIFFVERRMARFLESRNCGTGAGGFQKGNTCGGVAADVAASAAEGAVTGAAVAAGKTAFFPPTVATGAAVGAAYGVVSGLYDAAMSPTRAGKAIAAVGSTDEKVATLVKGLGGSPKSVAKSKDGKRLTLDIKGSKGQSKFRVEIEKDSITITPSKEKLSDDEVETIKQAATDHSGREVRVIVDKVPVSTMSKLAKAGFRIGVTVTGAMAAGLLVPMIPSVAGTAIEKVGGLDIEKSGVLRPIDKVFGL